MKSPVKKKLDTNTTGDISEAATIIRFLQLGYEVFIPYGGNQRPDLVVEDAEGKLWRIQCKTGRLNSDKSSLQFDTANHNITGANRKSRHYRGECDYFAVYNAELNKVYLVPVDEVGITRACLRLTPPKNNNQYKWAADYEF